MSAPFSYTHPSNIASGYRARKQYLGEDYPMYHRDHCKLPRSNSNCCACVDDLQEAPPRRPDPGYHRMAADAHNGARTTHDIVAAYGVYSHGVEETGFEAGSQLYPQQVVVVTSQRDGSTSNTLARDPVPSTSCRSALPLVLAALLLVVFLLVSGVLFYFNIVTYTPDSSLQGKDSSQYVLIGR